MKQYVMELFGTYFLLMAVATGQPLAIGLMFMVLMYVGSRVSGGHFNPAVTFAVWVAGGKIKGNIFYYWLAQVAGAVLASVALYFFIQPQFFTLPVATSFWTASFFEKIMTMLFCWVFVTVTMDDDSRVHQALITGFALIAACTFSSLLNPALAVTGIIGALKTGQADLWMSILVYVVSPFGGALVAGLLYRLFKK